MKEKKFSPAFERDYEFYFSSKTIFCFSGTNIKDSYRIQLPGEVEEAFLNDEGNIETISFLIPYSAQGKTAKECFFALDSNGKRFPCSEPKLLIELLNCKAAVNLQIKQWAEGRAEYTLSIEEIKEYVEHYSCPNWVLKAVEAQKEKILTKWAKEKKLEQHGFYDDAISELTMKNNNEQIVPDKIIIIDKSMPVYKEVPTITLYRPVGGLEHHLITQSGNKRFPPRLSHQPIFYPVLSEEYAIAIAKEWNTKDEANGNIGFVVKFKIRTAFISMYDARTVGSKMHEEYWIPADHMDRFNNNIEGEIETIHVFRGEKKAMEIKVKPDPKVVEQSKIYLSGPVPYRYAIKFEWNIPKVAYTVCRENMKLVNGEYVATDRYWCSFRNILNEAKKEFQKKVDKIGRAHV
jgi:hypothetical protein